MKNELREITDELLEILRGKRSKAIFSVWFRDLQLEDLSGSSATISIPSAFKLQPLELHYRTVISESLEAVLGFPVTVHFIARTESEEQIFIAPEPRVMTFTEDEPEEGSGVNIKDLENPKTIVEKYTFDNFLVADSNRFAHAACLAVANTACAEGDDEENLYNPLFIYGRSGLGKTHLLYAITNEIKKKNPNVKIIYKKGEDFTNELIAAMRDKKNEQFRAYYRTADVLLIDDIQFIAGKVQTQEEFFHTFSALYEAGKQIILTSDRPPREIQPLQDRLLTRFEWGQLADIQPPSAELRTAIILKKSADEGVVFPEDAVKFLSDSLTENIRQIEGAIHCIKGISMISSTPITVDMCRRAIADFLKKKNSATEVVDKIIMAVSAKYKVSKDDICGKKRNANIAMARHVCIYMIRELTDLSQSAIGNYFDRDHTTILNSIRLIENEMKITSSLEYEIEELIKKVKE